MCKAQQCRGSPWVASVTVDEQGMTNKILFHNAQIDFSSIAHSLKGIARDPAGSRAMSLGLTYRASSGLKEQWSATMRL
jgi:hypothetical protein